MSKNLILRISVALIAIPSILWICYQDELWLKGMIVVFAVIAMAEFLWQEGYRPKNFLAWYALFTVFWISLNANPYKGSSEAFVLFLLISGMTFAVGKETPEKLYTKFIRLVFGVAYVGFLYTFVYKAAFDLDMSLATFGSSGDWMLFLFSILWVGDSAALLIGKAFGKHKLAPSVSPNKTIEGFVGGLLGAILVGVGMYFWKFNWLEWYEVLPLAIGCSIFGQLGDLLESMWKRSLNIKDSSNLIPGHGGMLDRFDSLLFAAPFMYYYKEFFLM